MGGGKQWHRVLDQVWGTGPRGGTPGEKEGEVEPRASVCRGSGRARGSWEAIPNGICVLYDRLASVESKEPGWRLKTDEDLEALMKWMGKGGQLWLYRRIAEAVLRAQLKCQGHTLRWNQTGCVFL